MTKWIFDPAQGRMVPEEWTIENWRKRNEEPVNNSPWVKDLRKWLTHDMIKKASYSTRMLAYDFKAAFPKYQNIDTNIIRNKIAKISNEFSGTEDIGSGPAAPSGGIGAPLTSTGAVDTISAPVFGKKKSKKASE
jgi:hypothetical protein